MDRKRKLEEDDDELSCPICLELYTIQDEHLPRLFPCTHTVCEKCLEDMLNGPNFHCTCPTCRKRHAASSGVGSFPENQYLITMLKYIEKKEASRFERCADHTREKSLYCKERECGVAVCQLCLLKKHKGHRVVDLIEEHSEKLEKEIGSLCKDRFAEQVSYMKNKQCLENLLKCKAEMENKFNEMIDTARTAIGRAERSTDQLEAEIKRFSELKVKIDRTGTESRDETQVIEAVVSKRENVERAGLRYYRHKQTADPCGTLEENQISVPRLTETLKFNLPADRVVYLLEELSDLSLAVFTKHRQQNTDRGGTGDNSSEEETNQDNDSTSEKDYFLSKYSATGKLLFAMRVEHCIYDMAEITLQGTQCLALCIRTQRRIEFRDLADWKSVVYIHSMLQDVPGYISAQSLTTLLFESEDEDGNISIKGLHCATTPPIKSEFVMKMNQSIELDMCCLRMQGQTTIIIVNDKAVQAFEFPSGRNKWVVGGHPPGITKRINPQQVATDGRGHLFITDFTNHCIHMLSTDGKYLGALLRDEEDYLGIPYMITWSKQTSSLIVNFGGVETEVVRVFHIDM